MTTSKPQRQFFVHLSCADENDQFDRTPDYRLKLALKELGRRFGFKCDMIGVRHSPAARTGPRP